MIRFPLGFFSAFFIPVLIYATDIQKKTFNAVPVEKAPRIDGKLNDEAWINAPVATDFVQVEPRENVPSSQRTEVKVVYDNNAIYIGAMMYDTAPDSILRELTRRDEKGNCDFFSVAFDTYFDQQNMYMFDVTAAGVQGDYRFNVDIFDAVWESEVEVNDKGWSVEMKIPYSAIRFPKKEVQKWGVEFRRMIRRNREDSYWQYVPNGTDNFPAFIGILEGISNIQPPLRLSFTPYLGATLNHYPSNIAGKSNYSTSYNAGLDLKYGINESFTLDATLAPDFGQVQSDNQVLNLSAFETQFEENRPFFKEGVELFSIGGLFYPRRIGREPSGYQLVRSMAEADSTIIILANPSQAQLLNATKISGRTSSGLGLGMLNALTARSDATVKLKDGKDSTILTEPFTNYNIIALDQTLENNSSLSIINTNVTRNSKNRDNANVTGLGFKLGNKKNTYQVKGFTAFSQKIYDMHIDDGFTYNIEVAKTSGNFKFELFRNVESDTYNPNDLGILRSPDEIVNGFNLRYNFYEPKSFFLESYNRLGSFHSTTYRTREYQDFELNADTYFLLPNYLSVFAFVMTKPLGTNDFYEARVPGRIYKAPSFYGAVGGFSSDYRKHLALDVRIGYFRDYTEKGVYKELSVRPIVRVSDKLSFNYEFFYTQDDGRGYAHDESDSLSSRIYFGMRKVTTLENTFASLYVFSPKTSLSLRARHYWSTVDIDKFKLLDMNGYLLDDTTGYAGNHNKNFNFFNVDMIFQWRFAPGSDLFLVWKNDIRKTSDNYVFVPNETYFRNFSNTLSSDQNNTLSVKILYYLDYQYLRKKRA